MQVNKELHSPTLLPRAKKPPALTVHQTGWTQHSDWKTWGKQKSLGMQQGLT